MHEVIEGARQELRAAARDLKSIRYRLLGVRASIAPTPQATSKADLDGEMDVETEMHNVVDCSVQDYLDPLIAAALAVASYQPRRRERPGGAEADSSSTRLDLSVFSEATRQALYDMVVEESFRHTALERAGEEWIPPYTAEEAGLEVVFVWGLWFATWWKLELPEDLSEAERRECLVLEESSESPGRLVYREV